MPQVLTLRNLGVAPYPQIVRSTLSAAFADLIRSGLLTIDFAGSARGATYSLEFVTHFGWGPLTRDRNWYRPWYLGVTGTVNLDAIRRFNFCKDVGDVRTCEAVFRPVPQELGVAVANTAVHEAAHLFGLTEGGPDGAGHTGDAGNYMFDNRFHRDWVGFAHDSVRTELYRIRAGDTLYGIANRVGFRPPVGDWHTLYDFRGSDGRSNRERLRSGDPGRIFPGEEIWVPDISARLAFIRSLELEPKSFTSAQLATMRSFVSAGGAIWGPRPGAAVPPARVPARTPAGR